MLILSKLAFPDISSNGAWFNVAIDGEFGSVFGTSCAAPTVAALLGLINGERMKKGKSSVGFINPTLYSHPSVLNDITAGRNPVSRNSWCLPSSKSLGRIQGEQDMFES